MSYSVQEVLVSIRDVSLSFDGMPVLRNVNAEVRNVVRPGVDQGQIVGILGPSGIGKTQLSRIMAGLQEPTSGTVEAVGALGRPEAVRAGTVGVVAQNYPLLRHRTVLGNLLVAARALSAKDANDKAMDMLARFELTDRATFYPSQLSGGQRQRVAIAQQLLCSEKYIIMDEPFTGLDPLMKDRTCELISQVALMHEHNTIFVVAHDIQAVASIADTLWLVGRDRDAGGAPVPGSRIQATFDLAGMGLAWRNDLADSREFAHLCAEVKAKFRTL